MDISPTHAQKIRSLYDSFANGDRARMSELIDPLIEWYSAENFLYADHSPYVGAEALAHLIFDRLLIDWDNFSMNPTEILGGGDIVIASGRFRGTFRANGAKINAQFVQVFHFRNDRIVKCQMYTDTAQFRDTVNQGRATADVAVSSHPD